MLLKLHWLPISCRLAAWHLPECLTILLSHSLVSWALSYCYAFDKTALQLRKSGWYMKHRLSVYWCILLWVCAGFQAVIFNLEDTNWWQRHLLICKIFRLFPYAPDDRAHLQSTVPSSGSCRGEHWHVRNMPVLGHQTCKPNGVSCLAPGTHAPPNGDDCSHPKGWLQLIYVIF